MFPYWCTWLFHLLTSMYWDGWQSIGQFLGLACLWPCVWLKVSIWYTVRFMTWLIPTAHLCRHLTLVCFMITLRFPVLGSDMIGPWGQFLTTPLGTSSPLPPHLPFTRPKNLPVYVLRSHSTTSHECEVITNQIIKLYCIVCKFVSDYFVDHFVSYYFATSKLERASFSLHLQAFEKHFNLGPC